MAHINQRDVREQRKRRKRIFLSVLLFVPLALAVYFFFAISGQTLNAETVDQILVGETNKSAFATLTERDSITLCMNSIEHATKITDASRPLEKYRSFYMTCSDEYTTRTWNLYFSGDVNDTLLLNDEGKLYALTPEDAQALMVSAIFESYLYKTAPSPLSLSLGESGFTVSPSYTDWRYLIAGDEERTSSAEAEKRTFDASVPPTFNLGNLPEAPDRLTHSVSDGAETKTTENINEFASLLPEEGGTADVVLTLVWDDAEADGFHGTARYAFTLNYTPAKG